MEIDLRDTSKQELVYENPKTFVIGGDMGDVIHHLLFIKKLGGHTYHIDPSGGEDYIREGYIKNMSGKFNLDKALFLLPLLKEQSYLKDVDLYSGKTSKSYQIYDVNVSEFHKDDLGIKNLVYFHAKKYNLDIKDLNEPWLEVTEPIEVDSNRDIVINRTLRYRGNDNHYYFNREKLNERAVFVGIDEEYRDFVNRFGCAKIPCVVTNTSLELARVIKGHKHFIGNGSLAASIAIGLGLNINYEYCPHSAHYMFQRDNINVF
jgi:hypothetical protein|tara:strand:+ start:5932 stop:6717 length:786 start_codon:yes stop_codon:yes gene_type:complete